MLLKNLQQRLQTFGAACEALKALDGPPTWRDGEFRDAPDPKKSESRQPQKMWDILKENRWLILYLQVGSVERDLTEWRNVECPPAVELKDPATTVNLWLQGKLETEQAVSLWRGALVHAGGSKPWLIRMLRGTATQEIGGPTARYKFFQPWADPTKRPLRLQQALSLGFLPIGRSFNEVQGTHKTEGVDFIAPDGRTGNLDLFMIKNQRPFWFYQGHKSYSFRDMETHYT